MDFNEISVDGYERIVHCTDSQFSAYVALHNTRLGSALGGCRIKAYEKDEDALSDALDLARAMSYKSALANLNFGGGKCVVNAPVATPEILRKIGDILNHLNGDYICAEDVGTTMDDMRVIHQTTPHVVYQIDGAPWTALGVYACIMRLFDEQMLYQRKKRSVWLQGLGKVGWNLLDRLYQHDMRIYVNDIDAAKVDTATKEFHGILPVDDMPLWADIYVPCAVGKVVSYNKRLPPVICGSANNQLAHEDELALVNWLQQNGVTYVPDFLVNAGGVIAAAAELNGDDTAKLEQDVRAIADRMMHLFERSTNRNVLVTAYQQAEERWQ